MLSDVELKSGLKDLAPQLQLLDQRRKQLQDFARQPKPPNPNNILLGDWGSDVLTNFSIDGQKAEIAEGCNLRVTIFPANNAQLRLQLSANIPITVEGVDLDKYGQAGAIVGSSQLNKVFF